MITLTKLGIYERYSGDVDRFGLAGRAEERVIVSDADWYLIDTMLQDVTVIDRKLGSDARVREATKRLQDNCENEEVIKKLRQLAKKYPTSW